MSEHILEKKPAFYDGEVVQLNSGGPNFTIMGNAGQCTDGFIYIVGWCNNEGAFHMFPKMPESALHRVANPGDTCN